MPAQVTLPDLGENIEGGDVIKVLVAEGDSVAIDQPICELETDKAAFEVPSSAAGKVVKVHIKEGDKVKVGQTLIDIDSDGAPSPKASAPKEKKPAPPPKASAPQASPPPKPVPAPVAPSGKAGGPAAPSVRRFAREIGIDISHVPGSGERGRISIVDVKAFSKALNEGRAAGPPSTAPSLPDFAKWGDIERKPMTAVRRATMQAMSRSWSLVPHVTQFDETDITELDQLRKRLTKKAAEQGGKVTVTAIALKVVATALKDFPQFSASIDPAKQEIIYKKYTHIGVAVDTERGLLVPVIRDIDQKGIIELSVELGSIAERARNRKLSIDEMRGACFTITNLGGVGGTHFTPIINWPEVAILALGRANRKPVFVDGEFTPRLIMPIGLSYDHRIIDGADAARFIKRVSESLNQPYLMVEG